MTRLLRDTMQDLRLAWRALRGQPAFATLVVLTLAFGIGATTTLFGVVKGVLLAPLPYKQAENVAVLWSAWEGFDQTWLSYDEYEAWKAEIPAFDDVALYGDGAADLTDGDQSERVRAARVDRSVFQVLGVSPIVGRGFSEEEDRPNGPGAVVIGHEVWQRRYGADPSLVGRSIQVNGEAVPVVGVMPAGFKLPLDFTAAEATGIYLPLATDAPSEGAVPGPEFRRGGGNHGFYAVARLAPGATVATANVQLARKVEALVQANVYQSDFRAFAVPVQAQVTGGISTVLSVLFGATALVLLIACANVAGLLLVRGERRRRELAIRVALGSGHARLTRLLLAESGLLALLGAVGGGLVAWGGLVMVRRGAPSSLPRVSELSVDPWLFLYALTAAMVAAVLTGGLPVLQATPVTPADELKEGARGATAGAGRVRWRHALVSAEVSLAVLLVVGAGLMVRSVRTLLSIDPGFTSRGVLAMQLSTPSVWYGEPAQVVSFWDNLQRDVAALPNVEAVGAVRLLPLASEMGDWGLRVEGYTPPAGRGTPADWQVVTPGYFEALGLRLVDGRLLDVRDGMDAPLAMVVNRKFTELYLAGRTPLGVRVRIGGGAPDSLAYTIVGVVDDVQHNGLTREVKAQFYATVAHFTRAPGNPMRTMHLVVRTDGAPRALIAPVRRLIREADSRLPVSEVRTLDDVVRSAIAAPRFAMQVLEIFGAMALALAAIGIYGVVAQVVMMREHEFGVRAALGARPAQLAGLALQSGVRQVGAGVAVGVLAALAATRLMTGLLEGVTPTDPLTFAASVLTVSLVALLASVVPARRAAQTQPGEVLRSD
ncbi:MAG: ABC transporter permease [Gemmatimonadetes bacterium]|nr:ABC transporter permease [Gemmatimonadota bacterium]